MHFFLLCSILEQNLEQDASKFVSKLTVLNQQIFKRGAGGTLFKFLFIISCKNNNENRLMRYVRELLLNKIDGLIDWGGPKQNKKLLNHLRRKFCIFGSHDGSKHCLIPNTKLKQTKTNNLKYFFIL